MEIKDMKMEDVQTRMAEIVERRDAINAELESENADLDALKSEAENLATEERSLKERETEIVQAAEERQKELADAMENGKEIRKFEEVKTMTNLEVRATQAYNDAFAHYLKTGDDTQCRALLTENATSGTVPISTYAEDRIRTAWEREGIVARVRKTYMKGNVKIGFEISADGAYVHTEGGSAVTAESLVLGIANLIPESIKKFLEISDEVRDMKTEDFIDYVYDELTYRIAKKLADAIIADIEACGTQSATSLPAVPKITSTTVTVGLVAKALAQLSDEAVNPVVIMNKQTWGDFKEAEAANGYRYDPFEGLPVIYNNSMKAFSAATTGVTYAIVGDLGAGAQVNFPAGQEIEIKFDDKTKMEYDLIRILGRQFAGHAVVAPYAFCKIVH